MITDHRPPLMGRISVPRYLIIIISLVAAWWLVERAFALVFRIADILLIFGLAWLLKLLLDPLIKRLVRFGMPRGGAIAIAYAIVLGGLISGFVWLVQQLPTLVQDVPRLVQLAALRAEDVAIWLQERGAEIDPNALTSQIVGFGTDLARQLTGRAITFASSFAGVLGRTVVVITVSIYMSLTAGSMSDVVRPVVPPRFRDEYDGFVRDVKQTYSSYIRGYFYVVALGTIGSALLLYGFQVPNATLWVLGVFLFRLLPFIGGTLANVLLVVVFFVGLPFTPALIATVLLLIGQTVLTNVLMPRVMSRELGINPLLVLFAVLIGGRIYGLAGILFSIPAAAIIAAIVGKAVNRYLLPLYETGGWWTDQVTLMEGERRSGHDRRNVPREPEPTAPALFVPETIHPPRGSAAEPPLPQKEAS